MAPKAWADQPLSLIETPSKTQDVTSHAAVYIANEMAFAHNAMLRGINAIYQQAPYVRAPQDIANLLFFARAWAAWVAHHHALEEQRMFPGFERVAGQPGLLAHNVAQHHAFEPGLRALAAYATSTSPDAYDAAALRSIIDGFGAALAEHLRDEIPTLLRLAPYDGEALLQVYKECEAAAGAEQPKAQTFPMVLGLCDRTFEGGNEWPAMPWYAPYFVDWVFGWAHRGAWRFLPADSFGRPRELAFGP